ncbi:hypothetical protein IP88_16370 [alpha proteobacterium AAP81b]|nr:hypothetical protein IP88_16370 [alpha proteobacterium AAP81b]
MAVFLKDPQAVVDYAIDWNAGYLAGQTIAASEWAIAPAGADAPQILAAIIDKARTVVTLGGGAAGKVYRITNRVAFSDGRRDERSLTVRIDDR